MKQLFLPLYTFLCSAMLFVGAPDSLAREPQTAAPEVKPVPKGYDAKITAEPLLITSTTVDGAPIVYPKTENPEVRIVKVTIPPGAQTGWHHHPVPAYGYVLSGEITVELANGEKNTFKAGQALAEVVNTVHNGSNTGDEPCVILMVITGEQGVAVTVADEKP